MKKLGLTTWIIIALVLGSAVGAYLGGHLGASLRPPDWMPKATSLEWMSKSFIRLIKMLVSPIIFATLVVGLAGAGEKHIGRLLLKALLWFWLATAVALFVGLGVANWLQPGLGAVGGNGSFDPPRQASPSSSK
jgi:proton glutamate symport protein